MKAIFFATRTIASSLGIFLGVLAVLLIALNWPAVHSTVSYQLTPPSALPVTPTDQPPVLPDSIVIPKIAVTAPIQWDVPFEMIEGSLSSGVAHFQGTAAPGTTGNLALIGHSSDYSWKRNPYAAVFALLPKLTQGDPVVIWKNGTAFTYTVTGSEVVSADAVSVLADKGSAAITLITCYPIGTTWKRYVVHGVLQGEAHASDQGASTPALQALPNLKIR